MKENTMTVPEFLPVLAKGSHDNPKQGACVMEYVSMLAGEPFTDSPSCTHPVLARTAQRVNDRLTDEDRHLLVPLIGRLFGTSVGADDQVLNVRLAVWCARQVLPLVPERDRAVCLAAIEAAETWIENPAAANADAACALAEAAGNVAFSAAATPANAAAAYAANAAAAACATSAAGAADAAYAAAYAADATPYRTSVDLLAGLIDEYDRLTGRTTHQDFTEQLPVVAAQVGSA